MPSNEFSKIADEARTKYTYFVLAASAAAIGYSFKLAEASKPTIALLLFALAVISWAISFYRGCKSVECSISVSNSYANIENIDNASEVFSKFLTDKEQTEIRDFLKVKDNISLYGKVIVRDGGLVAKHLEAQFRFLLLGSMSFVAWRAVELVCIFASAKA